MTTKTTTSATAKRATGPAAMPEAGRASDAWRAPRLDGRVAIVTGASRGGGRGIARVLGACGATVYVTGRSTRAGARTQGRPETIEDAAEEVTARGGRGVAVRVDHADDAQVAALFERVRRDEGRLDLLVNNAWGGYERMVDFEPFWEIPVSHWDAMFAALRAQFVATRLAAPLLLAQRRGLVVNTTAPIGAEFHGHAAYDVVKTAVPRLAAATAADFRPHGVAVVSLAPGWMRTERVMDHFGVAGDKWREVEALAITESVEYLGRAVAALAADARVTERSGRAFEVGGIAREYGFTDVDGRRVPPFSEVLPTLSVR